MPETNSTQDLAERVALIESMLAQGRRTTSHWSWAFILWGIVYLAAMAWSAWGLHPVWAWPVCVVAGVALTLVIVATRRDRQPETTVGRAIGSIWSALGVTMLVVFFALGFSRRLGDIHLFVAMVSAFIGMANGASGLLLRWRAQIASAIGWWIASAAGSFGTDAEAITVFAVAVFLCQIAFGIYAMAHEARHRGRSGAAHA